MMQPLCISILTIIIIIEGTLAIRCYECSSEYDPRCGDPFDPYSLGEVNCSMKAQPDHLRSIEPTLCRKTTQKIFGKMRILRGCGYLNDEIPKDAICLKRSGTFEVQTHFCSCGADLCNTATSTILDKMNQQSKIIMIILLFSILVGFVYK